MPTQLDTALEAIIGELTGNFFCLVKYVFHHPILALSESSNPNALVGLTFPPSLTCGLPSGPTAI